MLQVIPAILAKTPEEFRGFVRALEPHAERVHLDIADGSFVPNTTIGGWQELMELETPLAFDVHLMVARPQDILEQWYQTKADRFIVHLESDADFREVARDVRGHGRQVGLTLNPETPPEQAEPLLEFAHLVQFMTVRPGFQGGEFIHDVIPKIQTFYKKHGHMPVAVDGGITPETGKLAVQAGASILVSGSYVVRSSDIGQAIHNLQTCLT